MILEELLTSFTDGYFDDIFGDEDYGVSKYKVNKEEVEKIRTEFAFEAYDGAYHKSINRCARYVRLAFERAFKKVTKRIFNMKQARYASVYGPSLILAGFQVVQIKDNLEIQIGDIVIFQETPTSPFGHIAVWNGKMWISDYRQDSIFPDETFLVLVPTYYRYFGY
jgi:hypothetical protein